MDCKIIVDSCCDFTPELRAVYEITSVPLTIYLGDKAFVDDKSLGLTSFEKEMKECTNKIGSAAPSPLLFAETFDAEKMNYVITLSSQLSGSYSSAVTAQKIAGESGMKDIHIFDSKSASAGETLIAVKLRQLLSQNLPAAQIIQSIQAFIDTMKTYFVLENYDTLRKNGRLNTLQGTFLQLLNIKLIMGADGNGNIALFKKARGIKQMLNHLLSLIENSGRDTKNETLVIAHCNNKTLAEQLQENVKQRFHFQEILIVPTGGISSVYANEGGIVMAF